MRFNFVASILSALALTAHALPTLRNTRGVDYTDSVTLRAFVRALAASGAPDEFAVIKRTLRSLDNTKQRRAGAVDEIRPRVGPPVVRTDSSSIFDAGLIATSTSRPHHEHFRSSASEPSRSSPPPGLVDYPTLTLTPTIERIDGQEVVAYAPAQPTAFVPVTISAASPIATSTPALSQRDLAAEVAHDAEWETCDWYPEGHLLHDPECHRDE